MKGSVCFQFPFDDIYPTITSAFKSVEIAKHRNGKQEIGKELWVSVSMGFCDSQNTNFSLKRSLFRKAWTMSHTRATMRSIDYWDNSDSPKLVTKIDFKGKSCWHFESPKYSLLFTIIFCRVMLSQTQAQYLIGAWVQMELHLCSIS